jgi:hypothetical protein
MSQELHAPQEVQLATSDSHVLTSGPVSDLVELAPMIPDSVIDRLTHIDNPTTLCSYRKPHRAKGRYPPRLVSQQI